MKFDRIILIEGPTAELEVILQEKTIVFGRSNTSNVVIDHIGVSRQHLHIIFEKGEYFVEDLGSRNGTFLNNNRIAAPAKLNDGDIVGLGPNVKFRVQFAPETINAPEAEISSQSARGRMIVILPDGESNVYELTADNMNVGRSNTNDISINLPTVSRDQFSLQREGDAYRLFVSSTASNPVYVNDSQVNYQHLLIPGDKITIGPPKSKDSIRIRFQAPSTQEIELGTAASVPEKTDEANKPEPNIEQPKVDPDSTYISAPKKFSDTIAKSGQTVIGGSPAIKSYNPPQLVVSITGTPPYVNTQTEDLIRIGRRPENDLVLEKRFVSRYHAEVEKRGEKYFIVPSPMAGNPLLLNGDPVMDAAPLDDGAKLRINGPEPGDMVTLVYLNPKEEEERARQKDIHLSESKAISIGRAKDNDMVLNSPAVSRIHAQVERIGKRYRVKDLNSSNGTFVNGQMITGDTWVQPGDTLLIGPFTIEVGASDLTSHDESEGGMRIEAYNLNKWVRKDLNIIQNISLAFQPREFIVVVGQSGGGKSSLVDAIAGYRPATHGKVLVNDTIDIYENFDAIRNLIGYVPQKDIIHMELTVFQALDYAAQLRMAADTTEKERFKRIDEVMDDLDLSHRKDTQISELSGGQQKRVSIGVELLTKPGLFFLDEPTSGLDPGMETDLMQLMRRLADQGRTIVLITHATKNVMLADKVVFLARGGYLTWFGPPEEALTYFDQFRTERQKRTKPMEFDDIYSVLDQVEQGGGAEWAERFTNQDAYAQYIKEPLEEHTPSEIPEIDDQKKVGSFNSFAGKASALRQFMILSARNLKILTRDRATLGLMLFSAPLMAALDFVLSFGVGKDIFGFNGGDFNDIVVTLIVLTNTAIMVGGLSMMRELVKEREIYKRERMVNLRLSSYIFSKLWFALILAAYQAFFFVLIRHLAFNLPHESVDVVYFSITVFLMVIAGMMMGLFTSAVAPNSNAAPLILVLFILPQMVLSGALVPLPEFASAPASSRWAFQSVIGISGAGSEVAADSCWVDLTQADRDALTLDEKNAQCNCMGVNALRENTCGFPGLGEFYKDAIDAPGPEEPEAPAGEPVFPELPEAPVAPENPTDIIAMQLFFSQLEDYNEEVSGIQDTFKADLDDYRAEQEAYKDAIEIYQEDLTEHETDKATAVGSAEATIKRFYEAYGWTFVDKTDKSAFQGMLIKTWIAQIVIILVLFTATLLIQKSRDVA